MSADVMFELVEMQPDVAVQEPEYLRLLGYPKGHTLEGRPRELADWARAWYREHGRPWIYARHIAGVEPTEDGFQLEEMRFTTSHLREQFSSAGAREAMVAAVSAGKECEEFARELWREARPDEYFFLEMYGSAIVEHLVAIASGRICGWADQNGLAALPHYSPGYSGWEVSEQTKLWRLIRGSAHGELPGDIDVMNTGMLRPKKSLLALFGLTRDLEKVRRFQHLIPCENCSLPGCQFRRVPYRRALPQIEDVRRIQNAASAARDDDALRPGDSNRRARYTVNSRALQKWARERLRLETRADGSIEATFRYEGTTCSNLGVPLEFEYRVTLGPGEQDYRILEAECAPAPGDAGHKAQCEYLNNADALLEAIAGEKPLLGRPLKEVLDWQRPSSPSGCYCAAESRMHKWGLVFEVIHFALASK